MYEPQSSTHDNLFVLGAASCARPLPPSLARPHPAYPSRVFPFKDQD